MAPPWSESPRTSVERYARAVGAEEAVTRLVDLLDGAVLDAPLGEVLAGPASRAVLEGGAGGPQGYWVRVWALRGLLYVWRDVATPAVIAACADSSWRAREMALKVCARRRLDEALEAASTCQDDDVARVRAAAQRVLRVLTEEGTAP